MNVKTLVTAFAVSVLAAGTALAGEWRGQIDKVDRQAGTLEVGGQTIHASEGQLNGVVEGSRYTVRWNEEGGRNVATQIVQDSS